MKCCTSIPLLSLIKILTMIQYLPIFLHNSNVTGSHRVFSAIATWFVSKAINVNNVEVMKPADSWMLLQKMYLIIVNYLKFNYSLSIHYANRLWKISTQRLVSCNMQKLLEVSKYYQS